MAATSNAAKQHSGTFAEYRKKMVSLEKKVEVLLQQHALNDQAQARDRIHKAIQDIKKQKKRIQQFLDTHAPRMNQPGREVKSNLTDSKQRQRETEDLRRLRPGLQRPGAHRLQAPDRCECLSDRKTVRRR
jgi:valyl-tRNA synthetase